MLLLGSRPVATVRAYLTALNELMQHFRAQQSGRTKEIQFQVERMKKAPPGPQRQRIRREIRTLTAEDNEETIELRRRLVALSPPVPLAAAHMGLIGALDEMIGANGERLAARVAGDKAAAARTRERSLQAMASWRSAGEELRNLGKAIH